MNNWTRRDLSILAGLNVQNEESFFVRRCEQRFLAGELTAREAIERIRSVDIPASFVRQIRHPYVNPQLSQQTRIDII